MEAENINTLDDAERFVEGCLNDLIEGISTKGEIMNQMAKYTGRIGELAIGKIERAFIAGRSQTTWEQFKKDNGLK